VPPLCWEVCRRPQRTAGKRLASPPACASLSLSSVRASLACTMGLLRSPYAGLALT
jgi:hypothetical protein